MEAKINIVEKLKDKPQGTKLYSLTYGDCFYQEYTGDFGIECQSQNGVQFNLDEYGKYCIDGECVVFPSKEMRDWSKFFKKGDVLVSNDSDSHIIFKGFSKNDYTTFEGKHWISVSKKRYVSCLDIQNVQDYHIEDNKDAAQTYINTIEKRLDGKLNRETLDIEKPEFKDGDIIYCNRDAIHFPSIHILNTNYGTKRYYVRQVISCDGNHIDYDIPAYDNDDPNRLRFATEEEKLQLFSALAKEGKAWDAERKQIVDLKPVWTPKPFDRVLVRDTKDSEWLCDLFSHYRDDSIICVGGECYYDMIPYEGNEHLLGTTKDVEG